MPFISRLNIGQQSLADYRPQAERQERADFALHVLRKQVGKARDRALRVASVQRGKYEVSRLGSAQGDLGRFTVADFTNENHVRILSQAIFQAIGKARYVAADFAL